MRTRLDTVLVDVLVDTAVRVAGEIVDARDPTRRLVEPVQRHHRKHLVDRPDVRQRLKQREVAEDPVGQEVVELIEISIARAKEAPLPDESALYEDVYASY